MFMDSLRVIFYRLSGDPLYVGGGRPMCFDPEFVDGSFAQDGYENAVFTRSFSFYPFGVIFLLIISKIKADSLS